MQAAESGDAGAVKALLAEGADVNASTANGATALMRAASRGHAATVKGLLERGADVNARRQDGMTALALAAFFGHAGVVSALLDGGAELNARDRHGSTALDWAVSRGHLDVVELLKRAESARVKASRTVEPTVAPFEAHEQALEQPPHISNTGPDEPEVAPSNIAPSAEPDAEVTQLSAPPNADSESSLGLAAEKVAVETHGETDARAHRNLNHERWRKRSEAIRGRIRERERKKVIRVIVPLPAPSTAPTLAPVEASATTSASGRKDVILHGPIGWEGASRRNLWSIVMIALAVLFVSGVASYALVQMMVKPSTGSETQTLATDPSAQPVLPTPQTAARSEQTTQTDRVSETPASTPNLNANRDPQAIINTVAAAAENTKRSNANLSPSKSTNVPRHNEPVVISLAQDEAKKEPREEKSKPAPPVKNDDERRDDVAPQATPSQEAPAYQSQPTPLSTPTPAATPKKKVIQWP